MDDQNKKNPFDEFFDNKPEGEKASEAKADDHYSTNQQNEDEYDQDGSENGDPNSNKSTYYYSYGPYKPGTQDGRYNSFRQQPEAGDRGEERTINADYQSSNSQQGEDGFQESPADEQVEYAQIEQPQHLRLAPVSAAAQTRGGWQMKEKRRSRMRGMLAAYLAGVITIGALMYAADTNNWFSNNGSNALGGGSGSGSAVTASASPDNNGGVSNTADIVRPNNIAKIFEQASPAVVKIETYVKQQQQQSSSGNGIFDDPFFRQFFGDDSQGQSNNQQDNSTEGQLTPAGIGTGFFFDESGYILTNQHVIADSDEIEVTVQGYDKPLKAKLLGSSYDLDLAVLKVEGTKAFPTLALGSSDDINIGDWVVAIGNPYGFDHTVTTGILSAKERPIDIPDENGTRQYKHLLQTDASINPGNSGGPLLNLQGEVVGINTAVSSQAQGIGFAIPTSTIKEVVDSLKNNQEIPKAPVPFIGIELANLTDQYAKQLGLDSTDGVLVTGVYYKSPAYMADVRQYDVITGVDGKNYATSDKLVEAVQSHKVGDQAVLNVIRDGKAIELTVTIGDKNQFSTDQLQQQQQQQ